MMKPSSRLAFAVLLSSCGGPPPPGGPAPQVLEAHTIDLGVVEFGEMIDFDLGLAPGLELVHASPQSLNDEGEPTTTWAGEGAHFQFVAFTAGEHRVELELVVEDTTSCGRGRFSIRGYAWAYVPPPCGQVGPTEIDFGPVATGESVEREVVVRACGDADVFVTGIDRSNGVFSVGTDEPLVVASGTSVSIPVVYSAAEDTPQTGQLTVRSEDAVLAAVLLRGNDCPNGNPALYDSDGDGVSDCGVAIPQSGPWVDGDGDGLAPREGDCDDTDASIHPLADELLNDRDDDCNTLVDERLVDLDWDGYPADLDCDDTRYFTNPGNLFDEMCAGYDADCDGRQDEDCRNPYGGPECAGQPDPSPGAAGR